MQLKRKSDPLTYTIIWWITWIILNSGLIYYGYTLIKDVATREFFLQSTTTPIPTDDQKDQSASFPEIIVCTNGSIYGGEFGTLNITRHTVRLEDWSTSPCAGFDNLAIISIKRIIDDEDSTNQPLGINFQIHPRNSTAPGNPQNATFIYIIHNKHRPFANNAGLLEANDNHLPLPSNTVPYVVEHNSSVSFNVVPKETQVVADGIWGLFGKFKDDPVYSVTTTADKYSTGSDYTDVRVLSPTKSVKESQILIKSIPGALGDWGGVFSTLWGLFYVFFGAGRLDPFGIFTALFIRRQTRRYLIEGREKGNADDGDNGDNGDKGDRGGRWDNGYGNMASDPTLYQPLSTSTQGGFPESMNVIVQRQGEHIRKVEEDFYNLRRLLRDYYLDIDLVSRACECGVDCRHLSS